MAEPELTPQPESPKTREERIREILDSLFDQPSLRPVDDDGSGAIFEAPAAAQEDAFKAPEKAQEDAKDYFENLMDQKKSQRHTLLIFVCSMAAVGLYFLIAIVLWQMIIRIFMPSYTGVSDLVINIITGGVFVETLGIVATIVIAVWTDPDRKV